MICDTCTYKEVDNKAYPCSDCRAGNLKYEMALLSDSVVVSRDMLAKLEESRKRIYEALGDDLSTAEIVEWNNITDVMWRLANTKWKSAV